jgi:uncharacterized protein DUF1236
MAEFLRSKMPLIRYLVPIIALALIAAQPQARGEDSAGRLNLTLEQKHIIRELIKDLKVDPATVPVPLAVGDTVPKDANLRPMPSEIGGKVPQIKAHSFVYTAERILIVDPKDDKVAEVIDLKDH